MNIIFLDAKTVGDVPNLTILEQFGNVTYYQTTDPSQVINRIKEATLIITNKVVISKEAMAEAKKLKLICVAATGTNNIDLKEAAARNIKVKNVGGYSTHSVAQLTFALLFQLVNKIPYFDNYVKQGGYAQSDIFTHLGKTYWEIKGKRLGIIGLGTIGRQVAAIAEAFGAEVVYFSASGKNTDQPYQRLELEEFLKTSDIITIHAPLNEFTTNLIGYEQLLLMKKSVILINVGRGGIIQEPDLAKALNEDVIAGAALDVFADEPIKAHNPLLHLNHPDKIVLTPHIAWASKEARILLIEKVAENIASFIKEEK